MSFPVSNVFLESPWPTVIFISVTMSPELNIRIMYLILLDVLTPIFVKYCDCSSAHLIDYWIFSREDLVHYWNHMEMVFWRPEELVFGLCLRMHSTFAQLTHFFFSENFFVVLVEHRVDCQSLRWRLWAMAQVVLWLFVALSSIWLVAGHISNLKWKNSD